MSGFLARCDAGAHGDTDISDGKRWGIVDPVTSHGGDLAFRFQAAHHCALGVRKDIGFDFIDAPFARGGFYGEYGCPR